MGHPDLVALLTGSSLQPVAFSNHLPYNATGCEMISESDSGSQPRTPGEPALQWGMIEKGEFDA
jgi:hypothetical protein